MPFGKVKANSAPSLPAKEPPAHLTGTALAFWQRFAGGGARQLAESEAKDFASQAGKKGRQANTIKQRRASVRNGKNGGRPSSRTLAERLLGQKLSGDQIQALNAQLSRNNLLLQSERRRLEKHFGVSPDKLADTQTWRRKTGRMPEDVRYIVAKFRLGARRILKQYQDKPVEDYVLGTRQRTREECEEWERRRPDIPCPPHRYKQHFYELSGFNFIALEFKKNPNMTAHDIEECGGEAYGGKGEAILRYLRSLPE